MRNKLIVIVFIIYILVFSLGSVIAKDRHFSMMENRNLAQFPKANVESVLNGDFSEAFENYMSDQLVFKDFLVRLKVGENRILNQSNVNGVFFAKDNMLIQDYKNPYNQLSKNVGYVSEFVCQNQDFSVSWLIIPNACYIYEDKLPAYASCYDQKEVLAYILGNADESINVIDCSNELMEEKNDYIFYKTDHHWTINGAYIGYKKLCDSLGLNATKKSEYKISTVNEDFLGSLYSNSPSFGQAADKIELFSNPLGEYQVFYADKNITTDSLYNEDNLKTKDKYTVYLDGNHSLIRIKSNHVNEQYNENEGKLLVIKDSYAHSLLPLLADNYSEIVVVDLRYYHQSVSELARESKITDILFINNLEFLSTDDNFLWLH